MRRQPGCLKRLVWVAVFCTALTIVALTWTALTPGVVPE